MVRRIYGRVRLTGRPALQHASRETPYVGCHIAGRTSSIVKIFVVYFFLGQGHDSLKFSARYLEKNFGRKIFPRGVRPPKFLLKYLFLPQGNVRANFHADISKTVACRRWQNVAGR